MTDWLVITHERGKADVAMNRLEGRGFAPYHPVIRQLTRRVPMFMGYMFVEQHADWRIIGSQEGVKRVLYLAGSEANSADPIPATIPQAFIDRCRAEEARTEALAHPPAFEPGDRVCLSTDEYGLNTWTVDGTDVKGRVEFLMEFMGKLHRQQVPASMLRKVG